MTEAQQKMIPIAGDSAAMSHQKRRIHDDPWGARERESVCVCVCEGEKER